MGDWVAPEEVLDSVICLNFLAEERSTCTKIQVHMYLAHAWCGTIMRLIRVLFVKRGRRPRVMHIRYLESEGTCVSVRLHQFESLEDKNKPLHSAKKKL